MAFELLLQEDNASSVLDDPLIEEAIASVTDSASEMVCRAFFDANNRVNPIVQQ